MIGQSNFAAAMEPSKIKVYVGPTSILADNSIYECIFVQLQDTSSRPARALQDTPISLSSSLTTVGDLVDSTITITKDQTFATAQFQSTFTPGATTIAAASSGYATVQTTLTTVGPIPSKLAVYGFPAVVPADGNLYNAIVVQLQDSSGSPAKAPLEGLRVTLSSSNSTMASVASSVTITGGQTYALASVTSTAAGSPSITAMASGYASTQATIKTEVPSTTVPTSLRIYVAPPKTLADNTGHPQVVVQMLNASGKITQQPTVSTTVQLSSSDENVGTIQPTLMIPPNSVYATATFTATFKAGTTTITAAATDLQTDTETITTIGPVPSKIVVYTNPSVLPADNKLYAAIQVQLQDSAGKPAKDPNGDVTLSLLSSDPTVGTVASALTIPYGSTYATTIFSSTYIPNTVTITAQASGYTTGQAQMKTYIVDQAPLNATVTANPTTIVSGKQTIITAYVTDLGGNPAASATVKFTSSFVGTGQTFTTVKDQGNGYYTANYTAPNLTTDANITITATISKTDYTTSQAYAQVTVVTALKLGTLQFCIKDDQGNPVNEAIVSTITQPSGMKKLTDITNTTGYVTFPNAMEGSYKINVIKQGYASTNQTINFTAAATTTARTISIVRTTTDQPQGDMTLVWLGLVAVIVVVVIVVLAYVQRRRTAAKFKVPKKWAPPPAPKPRT